MDFINNFYLFLASVMLISLSGVLMPGPLFAVTLKKAAKSKIAGALIAVGHGIVEFPLMFLIFFVLSQFEIPSTVQVAVGLVGGFLMIFMGVQTFSNRHKQDEANGEFKAGFSACRHLYYSSKCWLYLVVVNHRHNAHLERPTVWFAGVFRVCGGSLAVRFLMVHGCGFGDF